MTIGIEGLKTKHSFPNRTCHSFGDVGLRMSVLRMWRFRELSDMLTGDLRVATIASG